MRGVRHAVLGLLTLPLALALRFMPNTFTDLSEECSKEGIITRFLDIANPALYVRLDAMNNPARPRLAHNKTMNCSIEILTVRPPSADKEMTEMEALSLIILELNYSKPHEAKNSNVQVETMSYFGKKTVVVNQESSYGTNRVWTNNPTFLLSGQLTGFDPIDTRHRTRHYIHETHVYPPDRIISNFDTPAGITVKLPNWNLQSKIYLIFTSYKLLADGQSCREGAEYECPMDENFKEKNGKLCMSISLACDGLPNCGENQIPNPDEACFKIHWSSVLLSLVSYILLAITLLLCMSCFARILIQWSVRSSLEEMRSNSLRSSSRFFSLFGGSFSRRWERPPPTYDEAMKHVNPDLQQRPPDPPPYSDSFRARFPLSRSLQALRTSAEVTSTGSRTPPPDYTSCEDLRTRSGGRPGVEGRSGGPLRPRRHTPSTLSLNPPIHTTTSVAVSQPQSPSPSERTESQGTPLLGSTAEEMVAPLLSHRGSVTSGQSRGSTLRRSRLEAREAREGAKVQDDITLDFPNLSNPKVVRTSQSGLIPDTPGPLPEISGLIPDTCDIGEAFQSLVSLSHRTSKSGLLSQGSVEGGTLGRAEGGRRQHRTDSVSSHGSIHTRSELSQGDQSIHFSRHRSKSGSQTSSKSRTSRSGLYEDCEPGTADPRVRTQEPTSM